MFTWGDFLILAEQLAKSSDEASKRSAISRAYYAAFGDAKNWLQSQAGVSVPMSGKAHSVVWDSFEQRGDRNAVHIAQTGKRLKEKRRKADYVRQTSNIQALVQPALLEAKQILRYLDSLTP